MRLEALGPELKVLDIIASDRPGQIQCADRKTWFSSQTYTYDLDGPKTEHITQYSE